VHKTAYLSLGSNLGDRMGNLRAAIDLLGATGRIAAVSSVYETEPVEFKAQPWFLNCVAELDTEKMPRQLLTAILKIEKSMGRQRTRNKGPRIIDIDILLFGSAVIEVQGLTIPHSSMQERRFVLEPLAEIAPKVRHPVLKQTARELLEAQPPGQSVRRIAALPAIP
jgi:2-amino-4-hydroxy-6-hydroxymethyldihydropteridine diphosphokinase